MIRQLAAKTGNAAGEFFQLFNSFVGYSPFLHAKKYKYFSAENLTSPRIS